MHNFSFIVVAADSLVPLGTLKAKFVLGPVSV